MFDVRDEVEVEATKLAQLMEQLDVFISIKPKPRQPSKVRNQAVWDGVLLANSVLPHQWFTRQIQGCVFSVFKNLFLFALTINQKILFDKYKS